MAARVSQPEDDPLRAMHARDAWNDAFLKRYYTQRHDAIMQSGDPVRIRLYLNWLAKQKGQSQ